MRWKRLKPKHPNLVEFQVSGRYGLFTDPITRTGGERFSYQIPTYEALKGILHSVYWKPSIVWFIDAVRVMNPIQTESKGMRTKLYFASSDGSTNDLSYYTYLKGCCYQVSAHFEFNDNRPELQNDWNENKHHNIALKSIRLGGRRDVFLGARECQGYVEPCVFGEGEGAYDNVPELSFGLMYHGRTYADEAPSPETRGKVTDNFWRPVMKNGVISFPRPEDCPFHNHVRVSGIKPFGRKLGNFTGSDEFPFPEAEVKLIGYSAKSL